MDFDLHVTTLFGVVLAKLFLGWHVPAQGPAFSAP